MLKLVMTGAVAAGALLAVSIVAVAVFAVQPRLAIATAILWTALGVQLAARGAGPPSALILVIAAAPAVLAATAARILIARRTAT